PAVNDTEIETILGRAHALGAREAGYLMPRLPLQGRDLFKGVVVRHFPGRCPRGQTDDRDGALCVDDRAPLRSRLREDRFRPVAVEAAGGPVHAAGASRWTTRSVRLGRPCPRLSIRDGVAAPVELYRCP